MEIPVSEISIVLKLIGSFDPKSFTEHFKFTLYLTARRINNLFLAKFPAMSPPSYLGLKASFLLPLYIIGAKKMQVNPRK